MAILVNDKQIAVTLFPDKTSQVWKLPDELLREIERDNICDVTWEFEHEGEFLQLAQLKMLLDGYCDHVHLSVPYFPYARQDKHISNTTTFALRAFAPLLNSLGFKMTETVDFHNDRRLGLFNNLKSLPPTPFIYPVLSKLKIRTVLFPDLGAKARYNEYVVNHLQFSGSVYTASKVRDQQTGHILGIKLPEAVMPGPLLMIDDICDGGATFISLAFALKDRKYQGDLYLYISHGIFSKGLQPLWDAGFKGIYTHDGEFFPA